MKLILHLHKYCNFVRVKTWALYSHTFSSLFSSSLMSAGFHNWGRQGGVQRGLGCKWCGEESQKKSKSLQNDGRSSCKLRQAASVPSGVLSVRVVGSCVAADG